MKKGKWIVLPILIAILCQSVPGEVWAFSGETKALVRPAAALPAVTDVQTVQNDRAVIDYSNTADGYVTAKYTGTVGKVKAQVAGPGATYTYNLTPGAAATFPLSEGNGTYKVTVLENVADSKYAMVLSCSFQAVLGSEFAPFLRPNQYVDYGGRLPPLPRQRSWQEAWKALWGRWKRFTILWWEILPTTPRRRRT